jgi:hypothetical protein
MRNKQLAGLNQASLKKRNDALVRTEKAITELINKQQQITIRSVAREANVSVSYIYKYPELAYKIQRLREQQKYSLVANNQSVKKTEVLQVKNTELKQEIAELRIIIEQGKKRGNKLEDLQAENLHLVKENLRLKKELKYTLQNLQEARAFILEQRSLNQEQHSQVKSFTSF